MRKIVVGGLVLGALVLGGCDDSSSGGKDTPAASASAASSAKQATSAPSGSAAPSAAASGSAGAEPEKGKKAEGPKDHKTRLKAFAEAWGAHDAKKVAALYEEDAVIKKPGRPDLKGREAIEKRTEQNFAAFKDMAIIPGRVWEKDKDNVVLEWVVKGTNTGDFPEAGIAKATNKPFGVVGASWLVIGADGFIKEEHHFLDTSTLLGQIEPEKKHPVRAIATAAPDGDAHFKASTAAEVKDAKDEKEKAEAAKGLETEKKAQEAEDKFIGAMNGGKVEDGLKLVAEDFSMIDYSQEKDVKGKKAFTEMVHLFLKAIPDVKTKVTASFADGDFVINELEYTGVMKGPLGPLKPTNKPVTFHELEIDQFKDGKLVKGWAFGNSAELVDQVAPHDAPAPAKK